MVERALPDPAWSPAELLAVAEATHQLSGAWVDALTALDEEVLSPGERVTWAVVTQRLVARAEGLALRALASVPAQRCLPVPASLGHEGCPGGPTCPHSWEVDELAAVMRTSGIAMARRRELASRLAGPFARLAPLLARGEATFGHVLVLDRHLRDEPVDLCARVVDRVIGRLPTQTSGQLSRATQRALLSAQGPVLAAVSAAAAGVRETGISFWPELNGLGLLQVRGPVEQVEAVHALLRSHPDVRFPADGDTRTVGQRRVDLLVDLCLTDHGDGAFVSPAATETPPEVTPVGALRSVDVGMEPPPPAHPPGRIPEAATGPPGPVRRRPGKVPIGVVLTVDARTLLGVSNEPGMLGGIPVHAEHARRLCLDAEWVRRAALDNRGIVTDLGRRVRVASPGLRAAVGARTPRCMFPGCGQPAAHCEIDHLSAWRAGGRTDLLNTWPLCVRHHKLKHQPHWSVTPDADGSYTWHLPHGRTIVVHPYDYRLRETAHDAGDADVAAAEIAALAAVGPPGDCGGCVLCDPIGVGAPPDEGGVWMEPLDSQPDVTPDIAETRWRRSSRLTLTTADARRPDRSTRPRWLAPGRLARGRLIRGRLTRGRLTRGRVIRGRLTRGRVIRGRLTRGRVIRGRLARGGLAGAG